MLGGLGTVEAVDHSAILTQRIAQKLGAQLRLLPAPGVMATKDMTQALRTDPQTKQGLESAAQADIVLVGLGVPSIESLLVRTGTILGQRDLQLFGEACAPGDIALRYVDADGVPLGLELNERTVGLTVEQISCIPRVVGIAGVV